MTFSGEASLSREDVTRRRRFRMTRHTVGTRDEWRNARTYSTYARGTDALWGMYQWLDRAPLGRNESGPWFRRHDEYNGN
jgi:predicted dithiol-disulfide oxidoreductase (DUF899 family)